MKTQDIHRLYSPEMEFRFATNAFQQLTRAQVLARGEYPNLCVVNVTPDMVYRKIWAYFMPDWSVTVTLVEWDLVCLNKGEEVYRQRMLHGTAPFIDNYTMFSGVTSNDVSQPGPVNEVLVTKVGAGSFWIHPVRINATFDTIGIQVITLTNDGATPKYDANLFIQSQRGV